MILLVLICIIFFLQNDIVHATMSFRRLKSRPVIPPATVLPIRPRNAAHKNGPEYDAAAAPHRVRPPLGRRAHAVMILAVKSIVMGPNCCK